MIGGKDKTARYCNSLKIAFEHREEVTITSPPSLAARHPVEPV